jgi:hypothetical protein
MQGERVRDRVGLGWRPELAAGILGNLDRIDLVEVIADDYVDAGRRALRSLRTLGAQIPLVPTASRWAWRRRRRWMRTGSTGWRA